MGDDFENDSLVSVKNSVCHSHVVPPPWMAPYEILPWNNPVASNQKLKIMVKVIEVKKSENSAGKSFMSLKIQGGIEAVQSQQTGKIYLMARTCLVPTTFDEDTAVTLIGTQLPGTVKRVESAAYEYTIKETGEVIMLSHSYEYTPEEMPPEQKANIKEVLHEEA